MIFGVKSMTCYSVFWCILILIIELLTLWNRFDIKGFQFDFKIWKNDMIITDNKWITLRGP